MIRTIAIAASLAAALPARAAVKQVSDGAIYVEHVLATKASPAEVYRALGQVGQWWDGRHSFSGDARHLSLTVEAGGCFCEKWDQGSVEHGRVIQTSRDRLVRIQTALGPLMELAVTGVLSFSIDPPARGAQGSTIRITYRVSGDPSHALRPLAPAVDRVIGEQGGRLARFAETKKIGG